MRGFLSFLLDCVIPRSCVACGRDMQSFDRAGESGARSCSPNRMDEFLEADLGLELVAGVFVRASALCEECWLKLEPAEAGGSLPGAEGGGAPVSVIAPFFTNDELLALVRFLKFAGGRSAAPALGWWMARSLDDRMAILRSREPFDPLLVPVPLHPSRERSRGYNQSSLLAGEVAQRLGLEVESLALRRTRNTKSQSTLESPERAANVSGAFQLSRPDRITHRNIIVIDDLVTTGETALACVAAIEQASPASIAVLAAGRVRL